MHSNGSRRALVLTPEPLYLAVTPGWFGLGEKWAASQSMRRMEQGLIIAFIMHKRGTRCICIWAEMRLFFSLFLLTLSLTLFFIWSFLAGRAALSNQVILGCDSVRLIHSMTEKFRSLIDHKPDQTSPGRCVIQASDLRRERWGRPRPQGSPIQAWPGSPIWVPM